MKPNNLLSSIWQEAINAYQDYREKPSATKLFDIIKEISNLNELWYKNIGNSYTDFRKADDFKLFDKAAATGDFDLCKKIGGKIINSFEDSVGRAVCRFNLAARALLFHDNLKLADSLLVEGRSSEEEKAMVTMDRFLFRMRCRVNDTTNNQLFNELVIENSPHLPGLVAEYFRFCWRYEGPSEAMLNWFMLLAEGLDRKAQKRLIQECLSLALRLEDYRAVEDMLSRFPEFYQEYSKLLPLAAYLRSEGIPRVLSAEKDSVLEYAALYDSLRIENTPWLEKLADKKLSLAIVGNSPCELGLGKGDLVDAHDLVARFNNFSVSDRFSPDYGQKFNIHVRSARDSEEMHELSLQSYFALFGACDTLYFRGNKQHLLKLMHRGAKITCMPTGFYQHLRKRLHAEPSLGLAFCALIKSLRGRLPEESCFGFSFVDQISKDAQSAHYYEPWITALTHRWAQEKEIFEELID